MDDWDDEFDEESFENEDVDLMDEDSITPQEEAFMHGYEEADKIETTEKESQDLDDNTS